MARVFGNEVIKQESRNVRGFGDIIAADVEKRRIEIAKSMGKQLEIVKCEEVKRDEKELSMEGESREESGIFLHIVCIITSATIRTIRWGMSNGVNGPIRCHCAKMGTIVR